MQNLNIIPPHVAVKLLTKVPQVSLAKFAEFVAPLAGKADIIDMLANVVIEGAVPDHINAIVKKIQENDKYIDWGENE